MDLEETCASLDAVRARRRRRWRRLYGLWEKVGDDLVEALLGRVFPPVGPAVSMAASLRRDLVRFAALLAAVGAAPGRGGVPRRRRAAAARRSNALHADLTPDSVAGGLYGWLLCCIGQQRGWPVPEGGAGGITRALVRRFESLGRARRVRRAGRLA